jgi:hypothetical protein
MFDRMSNVERDPETRTRAMDSLLREICRKYKDKAGNLLVYRFELKDDDLLHYNLWKGPPPLLH